MTAETNYPPLTAYEALTSFFPQHRLHTVIKVLFFPSHIEMRCNCDTGVLTVTDKMVKEHDWKLTQVKHALRNVPQSK